jgi:hypothetical protein
LITIFIFFLLIHCIYCIKELTESERELVLHLLFSLGTEGTEKVIDSEQIKD